MRSFFVEVKGIVQGVGFRPFVYNLAIKHGINGWVNNDDKGVNILIYSSYENCQNFLDELQKNPPKLSYIDDIKIEEITSSKVYKNFEIITCSSSGIKYQSFSKICSYILSIFINSSIFG